MIKKNKLEESFYLISKYEGLPEKSPAIVNITRIVYVTSM